MAHDHPHAPTVEAALRQHITPTMAHALLETHKHRSPEEAADKIVDAVDALIPWAAIIPGWGVLLDAADGPIIKAIIHAILKLIAKGHKP
jgi:hypothetical protein